MQSTQKLPACHRMIRKDQAADILFTLASYSSLNSIPDTDAKEFHSLLCAEGIIVPDHPLPQKKEDITCFQTISEYKCGHLCPMCSYSPRNKNRLEIEESILLAYALQNYSNYQFLKNEGLLPEYMQSLFLLNNFPTGKVVPTLPLFRLAYSYIERNGNEKLCFKDLPAMIAIALDQNNPGKLLPQNVQTIKEYLSRLQKECRSITKEKITKTLAVVLHPEANGAPASKQTLAEDNAQNTRKESTPDDKGECIDGLLGEVYTGPEQKGKKKDDPPAMPELRKCLEYKSNTVVSPSELSMENPLVETLMPEENLFLPVEFSVTESEQAGFPFHEIKENAADLRQLEVFLQFNPLVGIEVVTDAMTQKKMVLLCASNQFYYIHADSEAALSLFRLYFSKSKVRRQICMDPFKVYYFLQTNDIYHRNVYALRTAYRVLSEKKCGMYYKKPSEMIKELVSRTNTYEYSQYIFDMLHYVKMYEVLSSNNIMNQDSQKKHFKTLSYIEMLLGISYELKDVAETVKPLFKISNDMEYIFEYNPGLKLKEDICAATFTFSCEKPLETLITDILYHISQKNLAQTYGYRLLHYSDNSITFASMSIYYDQLREIIANLSTYLAEKDNLMPLIIKESTYKNV